LTVLSYDRYLAICKPLHYMIIMNGRICQRLVLCSWMSGLLMILPLLVLFLNLKFYEEP
jgi:olfactory receptor